MKSLSEVKINNKKDFIVNGIMKSNGLYCLIALAKLYKTSTDYILGLTDNKNPIA